MTIITGADLGPQAWAKGRHAPRAEDLQPVRNRAIPWAKPAAGGLWTSTYDECRGSAWIRWCLDEEFAGGPDGAFRVYVMTPRADARVFQIDTYADLETLVDRYPHVNDPGAFMGARASDWERAPDWERVAEDFDAINLTDNGQWATRLTVQSLYSWDCESTLWLRWAFAGVDDIGVVKYGASACRASRA